MPLGNGCSCVIVVLATCLFPLAVAAETQQPSVRRVQRQVSGEDRFPAAGHAADSSGERHSSRAASAAGALHPPPLLLKNKPRTSGNQSRDKKTKRSTGSIWTTLGALGFVVVLILVTAKLLKKHGPIAIGGIPQEALEVLGRRNIDQRQVIHLVRCGSRILVVGSSPNGLSTLAEVTDPVEVDYLAGLCRRNERDAGMVHTFRQMFVRQSPAVDVSQRMKDSPAASQKVQAASAPASLGSSRPEAALEAVHG